jgi:uncharacterized protein (DUF305 family)
VTATDTELEGETGSEPVGLFGWPKLVALVVAVAIFAGAVGYVVRGGPDKPELNKVDIGFLADMVTHHQGAVSLSFSYLPNQNDGAVTAIAEGIITSQSVEISLMNTQLAQSDDDRIDAVASDDVAMEWMGEPVDPADMPGLASVEDFEELEAATGVDADEIFTRLMINHHAAGIAMAEYVINHGDDDVVRRLARAMVKIQSFEIDEMNVRREKLGLEGHEPEGRDSSETSDHSH